VNQARFQEIIGKYQKLRIVVLGDFCLDRYLEIDPAKEEISIETNLPVHNVVNVRAQPGGAGTILNNLVALGIGAIYPVGFCGDDGEGYELQRAFRAKPGVHLEYFLRTRERRTFTYCKPLLIEPGKPPVELNRLDSKNWTPTPPSVSEKIAEAVRRLSEEVDAIILLDQVDVPETGVITAAVLSAINSITKANPKLLILADSRRGLKGYPPVCFKMNQAELKALTGSASEPGFEALKNTAAALSRKQGRPVFVTLSERGMLGAGPDGEIEHVPALPVRGPIDIVGAGDSVTANLTSALAAGAGLRESLEIANAAASIVIHQLGTTGTARVPQLRELLFEL
jgi:rfaE bifunctional protein kinase chain/domain